MGAWGTEPWDNDHAADWFGDLWDAAPIVAPVQAGLRSVSSNEAVAAIWLCTQLCRTYVWPIHDLEATLDLAIAAATKILDGKDEQEYLELWEHDPAPRARLESMLAELTGRRA